MFHSHLSPVLQLCGRRYIGKNVRVLLLPSMSGAVHSYTRTDSIETQAGRSSDARNCAAVIVLHPESADIFLKR